MYKYFFILLFISVNVVAQQNSNLLIGTYTKTGSYGIYEANFNSKNGKIILQDSIAAENPSFLAFSTDKKFVYAVIENGVGKPGKVAAFIFNEKSKKLQFINQILSGGDHPCHVMVHPSGRALAVANYNGGNFSVIQINEDGSLNADITTIQHYGSSIDTTRQKSPHAHQVTFSKKGDALYVTDLGTDKVYIYPIEINNKISVGKTPAQELIVTPGSGPRHIVLSKNEKQLFILNELSGKVDFFEKINGMFSLRQTVISDSISKKPGSAQIIMSKNGKYIYTSNRATANTITVFKNKIGRGLSVIQSISTNGIKPRNFIISPNNKYLLVANQETNDIQVFSIDKKGMLSHTGKKINIPSPACLLFE